MKTYKSDNFNYTSVNEPLTAYSKRTNFWDDSMYNEFEKEYIRSISFDDLLLNKSLLLQLVQTGMSINLFKAIVKNSPFDINEWTSFLGIPLRTVQRYAKEDKLLRPIHSEKIIEFAELIKQGVDTFESTDKFSLWLCTPSFIFSNRRPCDLLTSTIGMRMVSDELINIEHGLFA